MSAEPRPAAPGPGEPNHARRFGAIWVISSLIATPLVVVLIGPILPPGNGSEQASGHVTDNTVLLAMATPVLLMVVIYMIYAIVCFRQPRGAALEGPAVRGNSRLQSTWIVITSALVLALAAYGTVRLESGYGAGSGSGAEPPDRPQRLEAAGAGDRPAVGVHLPLPDLRRRRDPAPGAAGEPDDRTACHLAGRHPLVLGLPARASRRTPIPRWTTSCSSSPRSSRPSNVRCAELCGIWHGEMSDLATW